MNSTRSSFKIKNINYSQSYDFSWSETSKPLIGNFQDKIGAQVSYKHISDIFELEIHAYYSDEKSLPEHIDIIYQDKNTVVLCKQMIAYENTDYQESDNAASETEARSVMISLDIDSDKDLLKAKLILDKFIQYHNLKNSDVQADIYDLCHFRKSEDKSIHSYLTAIVNKGNVDVAIKLAEANQEKKDFDQICFLAKYLYYKTNVDRNIVYDLFKSISKENPNYIAAQKFMVSMLCKEPGINIDDLAKEKFYRAYLSDNQALIDKYYHELCGHPANVKPVSNIEGSFKTLFQLGNQMRLMNAQNRVLLLRNNVLEMKVKKHEKRNTVKIDKHATLFGNSEQPQVENNTNKNVVEHKRDRRQSNQ